MKPKSHTETETHKGIITERVDVVDFSFSEAVGSVRDRIPATVTVEVASMMKAMYARGPPEPLAKAQVGTNMIG